VTVEVPDLRSLESPLPTFQRVRLLTLERRRRRGTGIVSRPEGKASDRPGVVELGIGRLLARGCLLALLSTLMFHRGSRELTQRRRRQSNASSSKAEYRTGEIYFTAEQLRERRCLEGSGTILSAQNPATRVWCRKREERPACKSHGFGQLEGTP